MKIVGKSKLVMIGDSITDVGRAHPIGEGGGEALGRGYVSLVDALIGATYPERGIRVVNQGTSGNTVRDLKARWTSDVIDLKPDWLSIMIGINDVWRHYDCPLFPEIHVSAAEYEATLEELAARSRPLLKGLVLMTPYFIEPNPSETMRAHMDRYGAIVKKLAARHDAIFVNVQQAFETVLKHNHPATYAGDRVHPNLTGHMVIARAFLDGVGFEWK
jgi:lysophospholipase L1-like esterase